MASLKLYTSEDILEKYLTSWGYSRERLEKQGQVLKREFEAARPFGKGAKEEELQTLLDFLDEKVHIVAVHVLGDVLPKEQLTAYFKMVFLMHKLAEKYLLFLPLDEKQIQMLRQTYEKALFRVQPGTAPSVMVPQKIEVIHPLKEAWGWFLSLFRLSSGKR